MKYILLILTLIFFKTANCQFQSFYEFAYQDYSYSYRFLNNELFGVAGMNFLLTDIIYAKTYNGGNFKIIYSMPYSYYYHTYPAHDGDSLLHQDTIKIYLQFSNNRCVSREIIYSIPSKPVHKVKITEKFFNNNYKNYSLNVVDSIFIERSVSNSKFNTLESIQFRYNDIESGKYQEYDNPRVLNLSSAKLQTHTYNPGDSNPYYTQMILENRKINYFLSENFYYLNRGLIFYFDPLHVWPYAIMSCSLGTDQVSHSIFSESPSQINYTKDSLCIDDKFLVTIWAASTCTDKIVSCHSKLNYNSEKKLLSVHNDFKSEVYHSIKAKTISEFEYLDDKNIIETLRIENGINERSFKIKYELIY